METLFLYNRLGSLSGSMVVDLCSGSTSAGWIGIFIFLPLLFAILAIITGLAIFINPCFFTKLRNVISDRLDRPKQMLTKEVAMDRFFYRNHKVFGIVVITSSLAYFHASFFTDDFNNVYSYYAEIYDPKIVGWLIDSFRFFMDVGSLLAFSFGLAVFFRPSTLKKVESIGNMQIIMDSVRADDTKNIICFPRWWGFVVFYLGITLYCILTLVLQSNLCIDPSVG
jgi:hypothetical protein